MFTPPTLKRALAVMVFFMTASIASAAGPDLRLVEAARLGQVPVARSLLKSGVDANTREVDGATALTWAAHRNDLDLVDLLLRAGANVNASTDNGVTALSLATENNSGPLVERLLAAGANPNLAQLDGLTVLMLAARIGNPSIVKALLAAGANVNATLAGERHSALMFAAANGHPDVARLLVEARADVHARARLGFTPLLFAVRTGNIDTVKALLTAGANVNETGTDGTHALPLAIVRGHEALALVLLEQGADAKATLPGGVSALHAAAGSVSAWTAEWERTHGSPGGAGSITPAGRLSLVKALLARGADPNARTTESVARDGNVKAGAFYTYTSGVGDQKGATPLFVAANSARGAGRRGAAGGVSTADIVRALLAAGADPRLGTQDKNTPLMVAAGIGSGGGHDLNPRGPVAPVMVEVVGILLEAGSDVNAVNEAGFTALHGAAFSGVNEVVQLLVDKGARINAQDWRERTPFRLAEGHKTGFNFQPWPETAELLKKLGADTSLGVSGRELERRDQQAAAAAAR